MPRKENAMKSRLTQLLARYIGAGLVALGGLTAGGELEANQAAEVADLANSLAMAVVGVMCLLADLVIHRVKAGGIFTHGQGADGAGKAPIWALLFLFVPLAGCPSPGMITVQAIDAPTNRVLDRYEAYVKTGKKPDGTAFSEGEAERWLRTAEGLRNVIKEARKPSEE
jgi:hypothetical protein